MIMSFYLRVYGVLAIANILMHIVLGHAHHLRRRPRTALANLPSASVIVPVFNEDPALLAECFESLERQEHPAMHVIVVDDGSPNLADLEPVYAQYAQLPGWTVLRLTSNVGKRCAQRVGFDAATTDVVVTVDSDTTLDGTDSLRC
jgi:cellulose synthase/poly-beta-1,6-N-acetylglucosamine synthase-like glycosyltransferase